MFVEEYEYATERKWGEGKTRSRSRPFQGIVAYDTQSHRRHELLTIKGECRQRGLLLRVIEASFGVVAQRIQLSV